MSINFRALQERLRERLLTHIAAGKLTGLELARETGFQQAHISNFLNRKRGLSLEAMDAILEARNFSVQDLLPEPSRSHQILRKQNAEYPDLTAVPFVDEKNCTATVVPKSSSSEKLWFATGVLQRIRPDLRVPRQHWERFVAFRVTSTEAEAMSPKIAKNAVAIVDRHYNSLTPYRSGEPNLYLIRSENGVSIRYVEETGSQLILRAQNPEYPLGILTAQSGRDPLTGIIGRICFVIAQT